MKNLVSLLQGLVALCLLATVQIASAAALNLTPGPYDFQLTSTAGTATVTYNSSTGEISITGEIASFSEGTGADADPVTSDPGTGVTELFTLTATFDTGTGALLSGDFQIDGVVRDLTSFPAINHTSDGDIDGLLSGTLDAFGIANVGGDDDQAILEFTFSNGDGVIADLYGQGGGMILRLDVGTVFSDLGKSFEADYFNTDWSTTQIISGDVWVPVPAAAWLFLSGILGLVGIARNRKPV